MKSVKIDQQQGMVTVAGDIDPVTFPENVTKLGKRAELWSFQKDPYSASNSLKDCCSCHGDSDGEDDDDGQNQPRSGSKAGLLITWQRPEQLKNKDKKKKEEKKKQETKTETKTKKKMNPIPAPGAGKDLYFYRPPWPMGFHRPPEPPFSYGYDRPRPAWSPPEYPFDHGVVVGVGSGFRSRSPPKVNRMMKYSSYADNYLPY